MKNNLRKTQNTAKGIAGFSVFKIDSNNPDNVSAYPGRVDIPPYSSRSTKLIHEQIELNRQVQNCFAWKDGLGVKA